MQDWISDHPEYFPPTHPEQPLVMVADKPSKDRDTWSAEFALEHELATIQATISTYGSPYKALMALIDWHCGVNAMADKPQWADPTYYPPSDDDEDEKGHIFAISVLGGVERVSAHICRRDTDLYTHWSHTQLQRPEAPEIE